MLSLAVYYNILILQASNENLLELYQDILNAGEGEDNNHYGRSALHEKMSLRHEIQQELNSCLKKEFNYNKSILINITCKYTLPFIAKSKYKLEQLISTTSMEKCREYEMENVSRYYNLLYNHQISRPVTDLLLKQKSSVESYLLG